MYNILVTGCNGQLGSELKNLSSFFSENNFFFTDINELDICNHDAVKNFISKNSISVIINCAAYTAVDKAESDSKFANQINHFAVENFAKLSKFNKIKFIHISTDYVFDGTKYKPIKEGDPPNPQCVYGKTKHDGELAIQKINPTNSIIIRTSWVYSKFGNNFVKTMLRLANEKSEIDVVADQIGSPTNAENLAHTILTILPKINYKNVEIFHYSNEGICSWYDFAKAIFKIADKKIKLNPIESSKYSTAAKRPYYSVLNKNKIKNEFKIQIPHWEESLRNLIKC